MIVEDFSNSRIKVNGIPTRYLDLGVEMPDDCPECDGGEYLGNRNLVEYLVKSQSFFHHSINSVIPRLAAQSWRTSPTTPRCLDGPGSRSCSRGDGFIILSLYSFNQFCFLELPT